MLKSFHQIFFLLFSCTFTNFANAQFVGGNEDGSSDVAIVNTVCATTGLNPFSGGNEDGHSDVAIVNAVCTPGGINPFSGGSEDGHSDVAIVNTVCIPVGVNPFSGGSEDGHSDVVIVNAVCTPGGVNPFSGGSEDGHSDVAIVNVACSPVGVNPFSGGNEDGHSDVAIVNSACTSVGINPFSGGNEDGYSDAVITVTNCIVVLPVQLLYFNSSCETNSVQLNWATQSERGNNYFLLERSDDNLQFEVIAKLNGSRQSNSLRNYSFVDLNPIQGKAFYRLTQVDYDGKSEHINLITTDCMQDALASIVISPNPNTGNFVIKGFGESADLSIYNSIGEVVYQTKMQADQMDLKLNKISSGLYYVVTKTLSRSYVTKMIVTK
jgi:hypothetical protein